MDYELKIEQLGVFTTAALVNQTQLADALAATELLINAYYQGADVLVLHRTQLPNLFFDLKSGIAGEILQKVSTYRMKMIILGDFSQETSNALNAFIVESNRVGRVIFSPDVENGVGLLN